MKRVVAIAMACVTLGQLCACATPQKPIYQWGGYQHQVYAFLKADGSPEQQLTALEQDAEKAKAEGRALPPGFRAHMALLCVRAGREEQAERLLQEEKTAFPESSQYMDFVLGSMKGGKS